MLFSTDYAGRIRIFIRHAEFASILIFATEVIHDDQVRYDVSIAIIYTFY